MANIYTSADQLIGKTPLLELTHIEKTLGLKAKVLAKPYRNAGAGYGGGGGGNGIVWSVDVLQVILVIVGIIMTQYFLCLEPKKKREAASKLEEYPK